MGRAAPDHHVYHLGVTHAGTPSHIQTGKRRAAHVFGATANGNVSVTQQNGLTRRHNRLQTGTTQAVNVKGRCGFSAAPLDGRHARQVHVFRFGIDDVAKHHMTDFGTVNTGARQRLAYHLRRQFGRGNVFQAAAIGTNSGAYCTDDDDFTAHKKLLV